MNICPQCSAQLPTTTTLNDLQIARDRLAMDLVCDMRADSGGWAAWAARRIEYLDREIAKRPKTEATP